MIFSFVNYKSYILKKIHDQPKKGRGFRSEMAKAMGSYTTFVSQVFNGDADLSLEQAHQLNGFLGHSKEESKYFLLMIQKSRAGTKSLSHFVAEQMEELRQSQKISKHTDVKEVLSIEDQQTYYSAWYYGAIHMALMITKLQTSEQLSTYLGMSIKLVETTLDFLLKCGLARREGSRLVIGENRIHLEKNSPMISKHHTNWRVKSIQNLESSSSHKDLIYSSVMTLSRQDMNKIKSELIDSIQEINEGLIESKEEVLCSFNLDFFELKS